MHVWCHRFVSLAGTGGPRVCLSVGCGRRRASLASTTPDGRGRCQGPELSGPLTHSVHLGSPTDPRPQFLSRSSWVSLWAGSASVCCSLRREVAPTAHTPPLYEVQKEGPQPPRASFLLRGPSSTCAATDSSHWWAQEAHVCLFLGAAAGEEPASPQPPPMAGVATGNRVGSTCGRY